MSLITIYDELKNSQRRHEFILKSIDGSQKIFFGISSSLKPSLFVVVNEIDLHQSAINLQAGQVNLSLNTPYTVYLEQGEDRKGNFHVVTCNTHDEQDKLIFVNLCEWFCNCYSSNPKAEDVRFFFQSLVRLFTTPSASDLATIQQGLWGELFFMKKFGGYDEWANFWHSEVDRLYDYSSLFGRIEVKTCIGGNRVHKFSHKQLFSTRGEPIHIVSILLQPDDVGLSLRSLINECRSNLASSPHLIKLEKAIRHAGMQDETSLGPKYNEHAANASVKWFLSQDVPHFMIPEPEGVTGTNYSVDLAGANAISETDISVISNQWFNDR